MAEYDFTFAKDQGIHSECEEDQSLFYTKLQSVGKLFDLAFPRNVLYAKKISNYKRPLSKIQLQ